MKIRRDRYNNCDEHGEWKSVKLLFENGMAVEVSIARSSYRPSEAEDEETERRVEALQREIAKFMRKHIEGGES